MERHDDSGRDAPVAQSLWRHARDLAIDAGRDGTVHGTSPAARAWLGRAGDALLESVHPQDAPRLLQLLTGEPPARTDFRFANVSPEAGWRVLEITATTPTARGAVLVARDVTVERQAQATLAAHRQVLRQLAAGEPLPAVLDSLAQSVEAASGGARVAILIVRNDDLELAAAPSLRADVAAAFSRLRGAAKHDAFPAPGVLSGPLADAAAQHALGFGWAAPVVDGDDALAVLVLFPGAKRFPSTEEQAALEAAIPLAQVSVVSHRMRADAERASREDPLTGVLARPAFLAELAHLARRSRDVLAVMVVQVDGLAELNERSGFATGDAVLREIGSRLAATVRGRDVVGRSSGTQFAVACAALGPTTSMADFADRVRRALDQPVAVGDAAVGVAVAVRLGTATRRGRVGDAEAILRDAERALDAHHSGVPENPAAKRDHRGDRRSGSAQSDR